MYSSNKGENMMIKMRKKNYIQERKNNYALDEEINNIIELTHRQKDTFKLTNNNPFLFSFNNLHPFSMFYGTKYDKLVKKIMN